MLEVSKYLMTLHFMAFVAGLETHFLRKKTNPAWFWVFVVFWFCAF